MNLYKLEEKNKIQKDFLFKIKKKILIIYF